MKIGLFLVVMLAAAVVALQPGAALRAQQAPTVRVFIELRPAFQAQDVSASVVSVGGRERHRFATSDAISADVPVSAIATLRQNPRVQSVQIVPQIEVTEDLLDWGVNATDADRVWGGANGAVNVQVGANAGTGVKVAVIDTGFDRDHPDLQANIAGGRNWVDDGGGVDATAWDDDNGHGTHVGGTIAAPDNGTGMIGVAPKATLYGLKVLDADGTGFLDDAAAAVEWATGLNGGTKVDVINMSFGCADCDFNPMHSAVDNAFASGVVLVGAAGNDGAGTDTVGYPAKYSSVIAVAALCGPNVTSNCAAANTRAAYSSTGPAVDIAAPGDFIRSTYPNNTYAYASGTSMASPHVAGVAALLKGAHPTWTSTQIRNQMITTATDLGTPGNDSQFGAGAVNAFLAMGAPCPTPAIVSHSDTNQSGGGNVSFSWSAVSGASTYRVSRATGTGWVVVATTSSTSFSGADTVDDPQWRVYVNAGSGCVAPSGVAVLDPGSSVTCSAPMIVSHSDTNASGGGNVTFSWSAVAGATQYRISRYNGSGWTVIASTGATSFSGADASDDPQWRIYVNAGSGCTAPSAVTVFDP